VRPTTGLRRARAALPPLARHAPLPPPAASAHASTPDEALASGCRDHRPSSGTITLASTVLGNLLLEWGPVAELGEGGIERWIAYPAVLWLTVFGGRLMASRTAEAPKEAQQVSAAAVSGNGKVPVGTGVGRP
jgi:hypothetical protein